MRLLKGLVTGIAALLAAMPVVSLGEDDRTTTLRFSHLGREEGLSQLYVNAIAQDEQGFLWFGTQEGLNRYDGYRFRLYEHDPDDPATLGADFIRTIVTDTDGRMWVGTDGGGLARYDALTDSFERFVHDPDDPASIPGNHARAVAVAPDGSIWVGSPDDGLSRLDPASGDFTRFPLAGDGTVVGVRAIAIDTNGRPLVGTSRGLYRVDPGPDRAHESIDLGDASDVTVHALWADRDGAVWVGTDGQGVVLIRPDGAVRRFGPDTTDDLVLNHGTVQALRGTSDGHMWVGTEDGLYMIEPDLSHVTSFSKTVGQTYGLRDANVQSIFEDEGGLLWIGTFRGASYWDTLTGGMQRYSARPDVPGALPTNNINGFAEDGFGRIWVATRDRGVVVLDAQGRTFSPLRDVVSVDTLPTSFVTTLKSDRAGAIWMGTRRSGLLRIRVRDGSLDVFRHASDDPSTLSGDAVSAILENETGQIWVAAFDSGLNRHEADTGRFLRWSHDPDDTNSISSNRILVLHEGQNGVLWLGHWRSGVDRLNTRTGRIDRVSAGTPLETSLVQFLAEDRAGNLWIGTAADGLFRWRTADIRADVRRFDRFTERHGLPSATIYSGVFDRNGKLWLGTGDGISRLDPETMEFENYDTSQGLLADEFTFGAAFRSREGRLYFGSDAGFNAFLPEEIRGNPHPPKLAITAVRVLNEPLAVAPLVAGAAALELTHKDYLLEIEVAGLDFAAPGRNQYRFRLEGLDDEWLDLGEKRSITYTNLEPGDYVFRARAANNYGVWSSQEAVLSFRVLPAPWATWWAYLAYCAGLVGLGALVYRARAAQLREKAAANHAEQLSSINTELKREVAVRREKEIALQHEKQRAETYFNVAEVVLLTIDRHMRITKVNDKCQALLGYRSFELVGRFWADFIPEPHRNDAHARFKRRLMDRDAEPPGFLEFPMVSRSGRELLFVWKCAILSIDGGDDTLFLSGMDVTRMRVLEKQVRLREKMNAIGTLAGGIAHDFNNILQAIYGFTTLALDNLPPGDEKAAYLRQVVKGAERARNLVKRILTFSNQKEYDLRAIDVGPVVNEACALLRGSLPATVEIAVDVDDRRRAVEADPTRVHQIVMNLGTNAAQAMEASGGTLTVTLREELVRKPTQHGLAKLRPGYYMILRVRDTGVGMTPATQEHIFDPFFTTKDTSENTGLGLTVVHGIVQSHGGDIVVDSEPGRGTEFTVYLPVAKQAADGGQATEIAEWRGSESVVLVDDEEWVLTVTRKILEVQGYRICSFGNAADALEYLSGRLARVDLVITDETMPRMTGSQFVQTLRQSRPEMPAIIISGKLAPAAVADPMIWYLQKPFTASEINEKVRFVLDEARSMRRRADAS